MFDGTWLLPKLLFYPLPGGFRKRRAQTGGAQSHSKACGAKCEIRRAREGPGAQSWREPFKDRFYHVKVWFSVLDSCALQTSINQGVEYGYIHSQAIASVWVSHSGPRLPPGRQSGPSSFSAGPEGQRDDAAKPHRPGRGAHSLPRCCSCCSASGAGHGASPGASHGRGTGCCLRADGWQGETAPRPSRGGLGPARPAPGGSQARSPGPWGEVWSHGLWI